MRAGATRAGLGCLKRKWLLLPSAKDEHSIKQVSGVLFNVEDGWFAMPHAGLSGWQPSTAKTGPKQTNHLFDRLVCMPVESHVTQNVVSLYHVCASRIRMVHYQKAVHGQSACFPSPYRKQRLSKAHCLSGWPKKSKLFVCHSAVLPQTHMSKNSESEKSIICGVTLLTWGISSATSVSLQLTEMPFPGAGTRVRSTYLVATGKTWGCQNLKGNWVARLWVKNRVTQMFW